MNWNNFLVGFMLFSVALFAGLMPISELATNYNIDGGAFENSFNKMQEVNNLTSDMSQTIQEGTIEEADFFTTQVRNANSAIKLLFGMPSIIFSLLADLSTSFGLPYWLMPIITGIVILSLIFLLLGYWLKYKGDDN